MEQDLRFNKVLLIEDEPELATTLKIGLRQLGLEVQHAPTLQSARTFDPPEFVLLDRMLPDGDGIDFCAELRARGFTGSIMILTARNQVEERVDGLNSGADDYLCKPFSWEELEARIRALDRRLAPAPKVWKRDLERLRVHGPKGWVQLTPLEFKLAIRLMDAGGGIVSREDLLKEVWGFTLIPKTRTVDHFMSRLRKHFEENPENPKHFLTVRGAGYRFEDLTATSEEVSH